jgi:hypothetical protein
MPRRGQRTFVCATASDRRAGGRGLRPRADGRRRRVFGARAWSACRRNARPRNAPLTSDSPTKEGDGRQFVRARREEIFDWGGWAGGIPPITGRSTDGDRRPPESRQRRAFPPDQEGNGHRHVRPIDGGSSGRRPSSAGDSLYRRRRRAPLNTSAGDARRSVLSPAVGEGAEVTTFQRAASLRS